MYSRLSRRSKYDIGGNGGDRIFKKGNYYEVDMYKGDPEGAIRAGFKDYLPVDFISTVLIFDENHKIDEFFVNIKYQKSFRGRDYYKFFDYFEIPEFSDSVSKYNL